MAVRAAQQGASCRRNDCLFTSQAAIGTRRRTWLPVPQIPAGPSPPPGQSSSPFGFWLQRRLASHTPHPPVLPKEVLVKPSLYGCSVTLSIILTTQPDSTKGCVAPVVWCMYSCVCEGWQPSEQTLAAQCWGVTRALKSFALKDGSAWLSTSSSLSPPPSSLTPSSVCTVTTYRLSVLHSARYVSRPLISLNFNHLCCAVYLLSAR